MARLTADMMVSALVRAAYDRGGSAMVLAKGDKTAGSILLLFLERAGPPRFFERGIGANGESALIASGPSEITDEAAATAYWKRRKARDSDLWVVELDVPFDERLTAGMMGIG